MLAAGAGRELDAILEEIRGARAILAEELGERDVFTLGEDGRVLLFLYAGAEVYRAVLDRDFASFSTRERRYRLTVQDANRLLWMPDPDDHTGALDSTALARMAVRQAMRKL